MSVFLKESFDPSNFLNYVKRKLSGFSYNEINTLVTRANNIDTLEEKQSTKEDIENALKDLNNKIINTTDKEKKKKLLDVKSVLEKLKGMVNDIDVTTKDPNRKKEEPKEEPKKEEEPHRKIELE
jgi:hypothetical protein